MQAHSEYQTGRDWEQLRALVRWAQQFRVVQGAVAAAKTAFAMALLGVASPMPAVIVGLISFAVYTANDLADLEEDAINTPDHSSFVADHPAVVAGLAVGTFALGAAIAWWGGGPITLAVACVPLGASLLYSLPVTLGGRRLKDVFGANTVLVALAWALTVTGVPLAFGGLSVGPVAIAVCLFFYLRSFISVEVFNVRDVTGDAATGVDTIPVVLGVPRTRQLLALFEGCSLALLVTLMTVPTVALAALGALPVLGYSLGLTWFLGETGRMDAFCLAKDAEYLLLGLVALALI
ncbi:UbiA family prenyltransferase [Haloarcula salinisoli]|uniref:UbiA family prenyltransferase n=1 Tax=Haloarcula salinisoli TaxID=2487746 RepID=A0A8J7YLL3_9EURY|nr:UbiA family prenyltransferase [Halomicroarcula salinisoli]MBX0286745.1 UbiA family prenyltransferase [Halomicroarcula salinisoli]MBX0304056.1 UbiA family prenyltransferase [Halomicroarcula salinisoli]